MGAKALNADKPLLSGYDVNARFAAILTVFVVLVAVLIFAVFNSTMPGTMRVTGGENEITTTTSQFPYIRECIKFGEDAGACETYARLAMEKYPGDATGILKTLVVNKQTGVGEIVWVIDIDLYTPMNLPMVGEIGVSDKPSSIVANETKKQADSVQVYVNQVTGEVGGRF